MPNTMKSPRFVPPTRLAKGPKNADYYNQRVKTFTAQQTTLAAAIQKKVVAAQQAAALLSQPSLSPADAQTLLTLHDIVG